MPLRPGRKPPLDDASAGGVARGPGRGAGTAANEYPGTEADGEAQHEKAGMSGRVPAASKRKLEDTSEPVVVGEAGAYTSAGAARMPASKSGVTSYDDPLTAVRETVTGMHALRKT